MCLSIVAATVPTWVAAKTNSRKIRATLISVECHFVVPDALLTAGCNVLQFQLDFTLCMASTSTYSGSWNSIACLAVAMDSPGSAGFRNVLFPPISSNFAPLIPFLTLPRYGP